jgi:DNA-binding response OmpR family regulator
VRILVVEDNENLARVVQRGLEQHGFTVDVAHRGEQGEELAATEAYDLVILDVMLPDRDGMVVCRNLRSRGIASLVLMLTGLSSTSKKIAGLEAGADDYLTKPFEFQELLARVRALLRRGTASEPVQLRYGELALDLLKREVRRDGQRIVLGPKGLAVLELLMRNADRVVARTTIIDKVWGGDLEPSENALDKCLSTLRRKIDRDFDPPLIQTVVGSGYRLGAPADQDRAAGTG